MEEECGKMTPFSDVSAAEIPEVSLLSKHHIHSSLESALDILIVVSVDGSKPLLEDLGVFVPVLVRSTDDSFSAISLLKDAIHFSFSAGQVFLFPLMDVVAQLEFSQTFTAYVIHS